jgi:uncharacterized protein (DUF1501 family)
VRSRRHVPVVFDDPNKFTRDSFFDETAMLKSAPDAGKVSNPSRQFLLDTARSAKDASTLVQEAWAKYHSPVDYGIVGLDLPKVAALIEAGMPTRLYYTAYRNNAFDTHVFQNDVHQRLLTYASDALAAFMQDLKRIGRADDVVVMAFSGQYGSPPSLTKLDEGDNLIHTTDFRRVYASVIAGWLGHSDTHELLNGDFQPFPMFS